MHLFSEALPNVFSIFAPNEIFKYFLTERNPARYYYSINVYIIYLNWDSVLLKFMFFNFNFEKRYNFYNHFIYGAKLFITFLSS